jgi:2'-5' RNA ligase
LYPDDFCFAFLAIVLLVHLGWEKYDAQLPQIQYDLLECHQKGVFMAKGIVSVLDQQHCQIVENLWIEMRQRFGIEHPNEAAVPHFSYHVAEEYDADELAVVLQEVAAQERPFTITASGIGIFPTSEPTIYVPVVRNQELNRLHAILWPRLEAIAQHSISYYAPLTWLPHITLGHDTVVLEKLGPLIQWLHQQVITWSITVDNFQVLTDETQENVENFSVDFRKP